MQTQTAPIETPSLLVAMNEAARLLGISRQTLEKLISIGDVPSIVLRRRRLVPRSFLERMAKDVMED